PLGRRLAAARKRLQVIKFQSRALLAPAALRADERALAAIAFPDGALYLGGNVARALARGSPVRPRPVRSGTLALLNACDQRIERRIQHFRQIPRRDPVAQ